MNKRIVFVIATVIVLAYLGIASVTADTRQAAIPSPSVHLADQEIPFVQTGPLQVAMIQGPDPLCPGWQLFTTMVLTNTSETDPLSSVVLSDTVPAGTWVHEPDLAGPITSTYDAENNVITWDVGQLDPLGTVTIAFRLRTFSSLGDGTVITHTLGYSATELEAAGAISDTVTIDSSICDPTPTPTSTPTNTPTPTQTPSPTPNYGVYLPLVSR